MVNNLSRLAQLERQVLKPSPLYIIMKSYPGQSNADAFDEYQERRQGEGYTPKEGWEKLKQDFLLNPDGVDQIMFITFNVLGSKSPEQLKVTRGSEHART